MVADHQPGDREWSLERAEKFAGLLRRGAEFATELARENQRLRSQLEEERASSRREHPDRERREGEQPAAGDRAQELEHENRELASRYLEVEEANDKLANLYVASFQLHSTLDFSEVVKAMLEIVINLIGADTFAIYVLDEKTHRLAAVAAEGDAPGAFPRFELGSGVVGEAVASGETRIDERQESTDLSRPIVCIPLRVQTQPVGAIAIYRLLEQKHGFTALDHELFGLLAGHAATAILSARLHATSERKLHTIRGFIDLLSQ